MESIKANVIASFVCFNEEQHSCISDFSYIGLGTLLQVSGSMVSRYSSVK